MNSRRLRSSLAAFFAIALGFILAGTVVAPASATTQCSLTITPGGQRYRFCEIDRTTGAGAHFVGTSIWWYANSVVGGDSGSISGVLTDTSNNGDCATAKMGWAASYPGTYTWVHVATQCGAGKAGVSIDLNRGGNPLENARSGVYSFKICESGSCTELFFAVLGSELSGGS